MFEYGCLDVCMWTGNVIDLDQLASLLIALHFFIISFGYNRHSDPITDALIYWCTIMTISEVNGEVE